jgi:hypothetical protein
MALVLLGMMVYLEVDRGRGDGRRPSVW